MHPYWLCLSLLAFILPAQCKCPTKKEGFDPRGVRDSTPLTTPNCISHNDDKMQFLFLGDWGGGGLTYDGQLQYTTEQQLTLATQFTMETISIHGGCYIVRKYLPAKNIDEQSTAQDQFKKTFLDVYQPTASRQTTGEEPPWYVVAGNHDVTKESSREMEIRFTDFDVKEQ